MKPPAHSSHSYQNNIKIWPYRSLLSIQIIMEDDIDLCFHTTTDIRCWKLNYIPPLPSVGMVLWGQHWSEYPLIIAGELKKGLWQLSVTPAGGGRAGDWSGVQRHRVKKAAGGGLQTGGAGGAVIVVCYIWHNTDWLPSHLHQPTRQSPFKELYNFLIRISINRKNYKNLQRVKTFGFLFLLRLKKFDKNWMIHFYLLTKTMTTVI